MGTSLNKGKFTVGGSNSKLGGESNHAIRKPNTRSAMFDNHSNKPRDLGMSIAMPEYGSSGRDALAGSLGKVKPFSGKMGGAGAGGVVKNSNPLSKVKK